MLDYIFRDERDGYFIVKKFLKFFDNFNILGDSYEFKILRRG